MNKQTPEKAELSFGSTLDVVDCFSTIQGEGPHSGRLSYFIRLAGCNLQCPQCDTNYTDGRRRIEALTLVREWKKEPVVVITGGEPFRQNITFLCDLFLTCNDSVIVQVESNGTFPPSPALNKQVQVVCSPKTGSVNEKLLPYIVAYKYVVPPLPQHIGKDFLPTRALDHHSKNLARPHDPDIPVYLTPEEDQSIKEVLVPTVENLWEIATHRPDAIVQCQTHKVLRLK